MNKILILSPRWHDRVVLVANHKLGTSNEITISSTDSNRRRQYPEPFIISGDWARQWPLEHLKTRSGRLMEVRAIPLDELLEVNI